MASDASTLVADLVLEVARLDVERVGDTVGVGEHLAAGGIAVRGVVQVVEAGRNVSMAFATPVVDGSLIPVSTRDMAAALVSR